MFAVMPPGISLADCFQSFAEVDVFLMNFEIVLLIGGLPLFQRLRVRLSLMCLWKLTLTIGVRRLH
jgi:hypothetical protein